MFAVGDKVKVVRENGTGILEWGDTYTVRLVTDDYTYLVGVPGGWYHDRFEIAAAAPAYRANDPATSKGKRKVNKYEQAVLDTLVMDSKLSSPTGFTGKDIAAFTEMSLNCITPRFAPLRRKGLIKDSGIKRDKQIVWVLA